MSFRRLFIGALALGAFVALSAYTFHVYREKQLFDGLADESRWEGSATILLERKSRAAAPEIIVAASRFAPDDLEIWHERIVRALRGEAWCVASGYGTLLESDDHDLVDRTVDLLARPELHSEVTLGVLLKGARSSRRATACRSILGLLELGPAISLIESELAGFLERPNAAVRLYCLFALHDIETLRAETISRVIERLADPVEVIAVEAASVLGHRAQASPELVTAFLRAMRGGGRLRTAVVDACRAIGPTVLHEPEIASMLQSFLPAPDPWPTWIFSLRLGAGEIGEISWSTSDGRGELALALAESAVDPKETSRFLRALLRTCEKSSDDAMLKTVLRAVRTLGRQGEIAPEEILPFLTVEVREMPCFPTVAVEGFKRVVLDEAVEALCALLPFDSKILDPELFSRDPARARAALQVLERVGPMDPARARELRLASSTGPDCYRAVITEMLARHDPTVAPPPLDLLVRCAEKRDWRICATASQHELDELCASHLADDVAEPILYWLLSDLHLEQVIKTITGRTSSRTEIGWPESLEEWTESLEDTESLAEPDFPEAQLQLIGPSTYGALPERIVRALPEIEPYGLTILAGANPASVQVHEAILSDHFDIAILDQLARHETLPSSLTLALEHALEHPHPRYRVKAARALSRVPGRGPALVEFLRPYLRYSWGNVLHKLVRRQAVIALGEIGRVAEGKAEEDLLACLEADDPLLRVRAAQALWRIGGERHEERVLSVLAAELSPDALKSVPVDLTWSPQYQGFSEEWSGTWTLGDDCARSRSPLLEVLDTVREMGQEAKALESLLRSGFDAPTDRVTHQAIAEAIEAIEKG